MEDDWLPWVEDIGQASTPRTRKKTKKKKKFVGWGSRELIEFLQSIGKDTTQAISHYDVTNIVTQYIIDNNLIHPEKKKRVVCDVRLQALFGGKKQTVMRNKIHDFLEPHLLEHHVSSDDGFSSSDEKEEDLSVVAKKQKLSSSDKVAVSKKKAAEALKSSLAALCPENIKLVYLRRSLVQELIGDLATFESKVAGSFVRIKTDPYDIFQKNTHQLQLVTGVNTAASGGDNGPPMLRLYGMADDISISALSDDNFSEEECEDLRKRAKDSLLKQPTVGELQQKVAVLHELITNNWLSRELVLLNTRFVVAVEKGWRFKAAELRQRMTLLQTPEEKTRLLNEIPDVVPEKVEREPLSGGPTVMNERIDDSPKAGDWDWDPNNQDGQVVHSISTYSHVPEKVEREPISGHPTVGMNRRINDSPNPKAGDWDWEPSNQDGQVPLDLSLRSNGEAQLPSLGDRGQPSQMQVGTESNGHVKSLEPGERNYGAIESPSIGRAEPLSVGHKDSVDTKATGIECNSQSLQSSKGDVCPKDSENKDVEVITLSDDDEEKPEISCRPKTSLLLNPEMLAWYYFDPQHRVQGPFSLISLKRWSDLGFFLADFRVWMSGSGPENAIPLAHILQQIFPC